LRERLAEIEGRKSVFYGIFERYGWRKFRGQFVGKTLLLKDIKDKKGNIVTDHLWFHLTKGFDKLGKLQKGQMVSFEARSQPYTKHRGEDYDYHLAYPQNLKIVDGSTLREDSQASLEAFA
jgi:hypothetical protein